jgi:hypothetical protein
MVAFDGRRYGLGESGENPSSFLSRQFVSFHKDRVPTPRVAVEVVKCGDQSGAQWVQMDIANQFKQVFFHITDNRFVAVLKKMAGAIMTEIKRDGIAGK